MRYLTLFTIGPAQSFIAKARKPRDLYAGSFLLSYLSKQTMLKALALGAGILSPDPSRQSASNRFLMTVEAENVDRLREFCGALEAYARQKWTDIAQNVLERTRLDYSAAVAAQIESLIRVYYASAEYRGGEELVGCYIDVIKRLGAAKTTRGFAGLDEPYGRKCGLMPEHNALFYRERQDYLVAEAQKVTESNVRNLDKYIQPNEALGAVAFVKRCLKYAIPEFDDMFPSVTDIRDMCGGKSSPREDDSGYYALVLFDGDDMGRWRYEPDKNGVKPDDAEVFQALLRGKISEFASRSSREIVDWGAGKNGVVVYAGGEDFLGVLNIRGVFAALRELRETLGAIDLSGYTDKKLSFSAGIVIAHVKTPLFAAFDMARAALRKAKARAGKDAFCLTIARYQGAVTEFVQPFYHGEKSGLDILDSLVEIIARKELGLRFIYQLGERFERIAETGDTAFHREIFLAEAKRLLRHSGFENNDSRGETGKKVVGLLRWLAEDSGFDLKNLLMYLRAIAFIARERGAVG